MKRRVVLSIISLVLVVSVGILASAAELGVEWVACDCGGRVVYGIYYDEYDREEMRWCTHGGLEYYDDKRKYYYADYCKDCGAVYEESTSYVIRWYCGYNKKLYTS